jgi:hypothetical protein
MDVAGRAAFGGARGFNCSVVVCAASSVAESPRSSLSVNRRELKSVVGIGERCYRPK